MFKKLVSLLAALALSAAACGGGGSPLAVVNGREITIGDMTALNPEYEQIDRFEEGNYVDDLGLVVLLTAIESSAGDDFGIEITDEDIAALLTSPPESQAAVVASWQAAVAGGQMTEGQQRSNARSFLIREEVIVRLAQDSSAMQELWDQNPQVFASACVRHILTEFEEEAVAAALRIASGEEFADVADDVSIDESSAGGLLADPATGVCDVPLGVFVPEFGYEAAVAPIGELTGPFVSDFGWHIIIVEDRTSPASLDEIRADVTRYLTDDVRVALVTPWINDAIDTAVIEVDPSIGTWSETGSAILPADG